MVLIYVSAMQNYTLMYDFLSISALHRWFIVPSSLVILGRIVLGSAVVVLAFFCSWNIMSFILNFISYIACPSKAMQTMQFQQILIAKTTNVLSLAHYVHGMIWSYYSVVATTRLNSYTISCFALYIIFVHVFFQNVLLFCRC